MNIETKIELNKFQVRPYQAALFDAIENKGIKRAVLVWHRRAGKDFTCFNLLLRQALKKVGSYYYILPTNIQARRVVFEGMTNDGKRFLDYIPDALIAKINIQEMKITLVNGSLIYFLGSNNFDSLRGSNPNGIIFSEYAYQHPSTYPTLRPILVANDGWAIFISCVSPSTLVIGENGLTRIKDISPVEGEYTSLNKKIFGLGGFHNATQFYHSKKKPTRIITLSNGYSLECTPVHPIWNGKEWIRSQDLKVGDTLPVQYGQDIWPEDLHFDDFHYKPHGGIKDLLFDIGSPDFFYILGLIHADGNYDNNKICITNKKDKEIQSFLNNLGFKTRKDGIHHELSSKPLCALLDYLGFQHGAKNKVFPERLLSCSKEQMKSFLQGVFDGDGSSHSNPSYGGRIYFHSSSKEFIDVLKVVLLNFGIVSSFRASVTPPNKLIKVYSTIYAIEITGYFAHIFYENIGFRLERKQYNSRYVSDRSKQDHESVYAIDISRLDGYKLPKNLVTNPHRMSRRVVKKLNDRKPHEYLQELLSEKFVYSPIQSIEESESDVYDFVIPETHSFFSNGLISHNTPQGENHFYKLFEVAKNSDDWFCDVKTINDTEVVSPESIEQEEREGLMSPDMIQQEYMCSFKIGATGSYYSQYLNKMELNDQIGVVPWEPAFPVYTAWDLGVRDATVILFFQIIGKTVNIIDCYSSDSKGLEHYVSVVLSKEYQYAKHFAPHDIMVRELGSGITRLDKAKQLGIKFEIKVDRNNVKSSAVPNVSIMDGIETVRTTLPKIWIDHVKCKDLIAAIRDYRREYDNKNQVYKGSPLHDKSSHFCDALRYLCLSLRYCRRSTSADDIERNYREAMLGDDHNMPAMFRDNNHY